MNGVFPLAPVPCTIDGLTADIDLFVLALLAHSPPLSLLTVLCSGSGPIVSNYFVGTRQTSGHFQWTDQFSHDLGHWSARGSMNRVLFDY